MVIAYAYELLRTSADRRTAEYRAHRIEVPDAPESSAWVRCEAHEKDFVVTHAGLPLPCCSAKT